MFTTSDNEYMLQALSLAAKPLNSPHPNPRVGCVIVKSGKVVGQGFHIEAGGPHAEVHALQQAGELARGATVYVTLEPCCHHGKTPPCSDALITAGVAKVVVAMQDPNPEVAGGGIKQLRNAGVEVVSGILETQARELNKGFIRRLTQRRPWVSSKIAVSLDGRTALANGRSQWITGEEARQDVQKLRAQASAIMTGLGTVIADNPRLNVRAAECLTDSQRQPVRVVVDSQLGIDEGAEVLKEPGEVWLATTERKVEKRFAHNVTVKQCKSTSSRVELEDLLEQLAANSINEVLVEAGPTLNGALLQQKLLDEMVVYMAPVILGDKARSMFILPELHSMQERFQMKILDVSPVGEDIKIRLRKEH